MSKYGLLLLTAILLIGCNQQEILPSLPLTTSAKHLEDKQEIELVDVVVQKESDEVLEDKTTETEDKPEQIEKDPILVVDNPTSVEVLVNKQRKLPDGYSPKDLVVPNVPFYFSEDDPKKKMRKEAAAALEKLFKGAEQAQLDLVAASGYRSYERQKTIYEYNVTTRGQAVADKYSARPGTSEHQTGLAMDVTTAQVAFSLEETFRQTNEGEWLEQNAHSYGFVIRYPKGKEEITGYSYEPWHIRYVGKSIATEIYDQSLTLEEYFTRE
ncbi:M15 family metallopeptidase [Aquibacillus salsiterrae]|uniref:M15 family metallopeptidase n=1 Tax=Aquibacillus salsiterrae TaxID=2950439 RepID=A0A9X4AEX9_9BACI|nr:M15 family metallopeptidase [Aquibacillus salsiterrae]MDC3417296.1 M15 family metallopeptidase [Aquibacillus salsiterrae]